MHRITSPEALRLTRLVAAAEWQVTLVLLSIGLSNSAMLCFRRSRTCAYVLPFPAGIVSVNPMVHDFTLRK